MPVALEAGADLEPQIWRMLEVIHHALSEIDTLLLQPDRPAAMLKSLL
jgi:hypothetical protein